MRISALVGGAEIAGTLTENGNVVAEVVPIVRTAMRPK